MIDKRDGGPEFPRPHSEIEVRWSFPPLEFVGDHGVTLRQWYAGMAMQALITLEGIDRDDITVEAYRQADSMIGHELKELE